MIVVLIVISTIFYFIGAVITYTLLEKYDENFYQTAGIFAAAVWSVLAGTLSGMGIGRPYCVLPISASQADLEGKMKILA